MTPPEAVDPLDEVKRSVWVQCFILSIIKWWTGNRGVRSPTLSWKNTATSRRASRTQGRNRWTWSATILRQAVVFKRCSIGTEGPKLCQENIPLTITPPPAWTVETRQDGCMLSCFLRQILTLPSECRRRNRDSSDQATFFQSSIVQFWWVCEL